MAPPSSLSTRAGKDFYSNITLIGMAGAGKSALGKILAQKTGFEFIDTDSVIESFGEDLPKIISRDGEEAFLILEENVILGLCGSNKVFAPGGSCIYSDKAMRHLRNISIVVFIDIPFETAQKRLADRKDDLGRIVCRGNLSLKELFLHRKMLYQKYSHIQVSLVEAHKDANADKILDEISKHLRKYPDGTVSCDDQQPARYCSQDP